MKRIKLFEEFHLNEDDVRKWIITFEITDTKGMDVKEATKVIDEHYARHLTYRGNEFFDKIYMGTLHTFSKEELKIGTTEDVDVEYSDEETGEWRTEKEKEKISGQESYLGYLPEQDVFVEGWDMFGNYERNNVIFIRLDDDLEPKNVSDEFDKKGSYYGMMYGGEGSSYNKLHKQFPNLIDIRLD